MLRLSKHVILLGALNIVTIIFLSFEAVADERRLVYITPMAGENFSYLDIELPCGEELVSIRFVASKEADIISSTMLQRLSTSHMSKESDPTNLKHVLLTAALFGTNCDVPSNLDLSAPLMDVSYLFEGESSLHRSIRNIDSAKLNYEEYNSLYAAFLLSGIRPRNEDILNTYTILFRDDCVEYLREKEPEVWSEIYPSLIQFDELYESIQNIGSEYHEVRYGRKVSRVTFVMTDIFADCAYGNIESIATLINANIKALEFSLGIVQEGRIEPEKIRSGDWLTYLTPWGAISRNDSSAQNGEVIWFECSLTMKHSRFDLKRANGVGEAYVEYSFSFTFTDKVLDRLAFDRSLYSFRGDRFSQPDWVSSVYDAPVWQPFVLYIEEDHLNMLMAASQARSIEVWSSDQPRIKHLISPRGSARAIKLMQDHCDSLLQ